MLINPLPAFERNDFVRWYRRHFHHRLTKSLESSTALVAFAFGNHEFLVGHNRRNRQSLRNWARCRSLCGFIVFTSANGIFADMAILADIFKANRYAGGDSRFLHRDAV